MQKLRNEDSQSVSNRLENGYGRDRVTRYTNPLKNASNETELPSFTKTNYGKWTCVMRALKEYNDGVTFLLTVIDVFSKYAFAKPLLDKKGSTVLNAFQMILEESDRKPSNVQTDHGSEFVNRGFRSA